MDTAVQIAENVLDLRLDRFEVAVRTQNCFYREGIYTVAQLVALTPAVIMSWYGAGSRTLEDIRNLLGGLGLSLSEDSSTPPFLNGTVRLKEEPPQISPPVVNSISLSQVDPVIQKILVSRLRDFDLSARAKNVLKKKKIIFLGQLVQLQIREFKSHPNIGKKTIEELLNLVEKYGFKPETKIDDWSDELVRQIGIPEADKKSVAPLTLAGNAPVYLEEELEGVARLLMKDRNAEILIKLWGWDGGGKRTLETVGCEFSLTRERVRQIEAKALKRLKRLQCEISILPQAIKALQGILPATEEQLKHFLPQLKLTKCIFDPSGLEFAAKILEIKWPIVEMNAQGYQYFVHRDDAASFSKICAAVRRRTSDSGCLNITSLSSEIGLSENRQNALRRHLNSIAGVVWLDEAKTWLYLKNNPRNRLFNLCSKVLAVCPRIRISELRRAVAKSRRLAMAPSQYILAAFLENTGLGQINEGYVIANPSMTSPPKPDSVEGRLLKVLDEHGPVLSGNDFAEKCIANEVNAISFYVYKLISPVISTLARGIYSKVVTFSPQMSPK